MKTQDKMMIMYSIKRINQPNNHLIYEVMGRFTVNRSKAIEIVTKAKEMISK